VYENYVRPFLRKHENQIDARVDEIGKEFTSAAKRLSTRVVNAAVNSVLNKKDE